MIPALLDHLWQSTLFALGCGLLTLMLGSNGAHTRYWLWFAASVKFLIPFSLLTKAGAFLLAPFASTAWPTFPLLQQAAEPFSIREPILAVPAATGFDFLPILLAVWAIGFAAVLLSWLMRWTKMRTALRAARPVELLAPIPVKSSPALLEPGLVGIWKPVLLVPDGITNRLLPEEMYAVLAHELCHLERRDNLTAAIHMLVEAVFWFHPLVWWLSGRLINERERACDESVVEGGSDPETYAQGILKVCQHYLHSPLACAAGVSGADLKRRMETIMSNQAVMRLNSVKKFLLTACAVCAVLLPMLTGLPAQSAMRTQALITPEEMSRKLAEQVMPRTAVAFDPQKFDKFVGYYEGMGRIFTISRNSGRFFTALTAQPRLEVFPESETKFFATATYAQISFESDITGRTTGLVLHQGGAEFSFKKIDDAAAKNIEAAFNLRIKNQTQSPGTQAALSRHILSFVKSGDPAVSEMTPELAAAVRQQRPVSMQLRDKYGALKAIIFKGVGPGGADIYEVDFENTKTEWRIMPLTPEGKTAGLGFRELP